MTPPLGIRSHYRRVTHRQLTLWNISVDLIAKIKAEREAEVRVFYHFCGVSLPMYSHNTRS